MESQMVRKHGKICLIFPDPGEPMEHVIERGIYVLDQNPNSQTEYNKAILHSRIYTNKKYLGASYMSA